jgi:D-glycero-alpha-D-manno-heptose 1-phosphate guanylyltransferase
MVTDAIILAGGKGTRMCGEVPKPLARMFGKTLISHQIEYLERNPSVNNIIISLGYKADQVMDYLKDHHLQSRLMVSVENMPLGTAGALKQALRYATTEYVIVLNVDNVSDIDVEKLIAANENSIVISKGIRRSQYGRVDIVNGFAKFTEKPIIEHWTSTGWYLFDRQQILEKLPDSGSLESDVLQNIRLKPFVHTGNIWSLDSLKDIQHVESMAFAWGRA